jgi:hypothetical protein
MWFNLPQHQAEQRYKQDLLQLRKDELAEQGRVHSAQVASYVASGDFDRARAAAEKSRLDAQTRLADSFATLSTNPGDINAIREAARNIAFLGDKEAKTLAQVLQLQNPAMQRLIATGGSPLVELGAKESLFDVGDPKGPSLVATGGVDLAQDHKWLSPTVKGEPPATLATGLTTPFLSQLLSQIGTVAPILVDTTRSPLPEPAQKNTAFLYNNALTNALSAVQKLNTTNAPPSLTATNAAPAPVLKRYRIRERSTGKVMGADGMTPAELDAAGYDIIGELP